MRSIKTRSGITVSIVLRSEAKPTGISFFEDEWDWCQTMSQSYRSDPEALESFWKTVLEKKLIDSSYSFFDDFPRVSSENESRKEMAIRYCGEILKMLGRGKRDVGESLGKEKSENDGNEIPLKKG